MDEVILSGLETPSYSLTYSLRIPASRFVEELVYDHLITFDDERLVVVFRRQKLSRLYQSASRNWTVLASLNSRSFQKLWRGTRVLCWTLPESEL